MWENMLRAGFKWPPGANVEIGIIDTLHVTHPEKNVFVT